MRYVTIVRVPRERHDSLIDDVTPSLTQKEFDPQTCILRVLLISQNYILFDIVSYVLF